MGQRLQSSGALPQSELLRTDIIQQRLEQHDLDQLEKNIGLMYRGRPDVARRARFMCFSTQHALVIITKPTHRGADIVYIKTNVLPLRQGYGTALMRKEKASSPCKWFY